MKLGIIKTATIDCLVGDVFEIQENNVEMSGRGYADLTVIDAPNLLTADFKAEYEGKKPDKREIKEWRKNGVWYKIKKESKYQKNVTEFDKEFLKTASSSEAKNHIKDKVKDTLELYSENVEESVE